MVFLDLPLSELMKFDRCPEPHVSVDCSHSSCYDCPLFLDLKECGYETKIED